MSATPIITYQQPFGDVDYGPSAGVNYIILIPADADPDQAAKDLWDYLNKNWQDDWQEYRRSSVLMTMSNGDKAVQVIVWTRWGDRHRSVTT
jgi:hypothetical protein